MQTKPDCIFCDIVSGKAPSHKVWEDRKHLAFLSIFPNTEGVTVIIPKKHYPSYTFDLSDVVLSELTLASKKVAKLFDSKLRGVGRTALVFEGYGVDHAHTKLFPMHGTAKTGKWKKIASSVDKYFNKYEGYISSHDYKRANDTKLAKLARKIRKK
ncbi:diadenosine tetraphosphate hydrolase [Candidatus Kaiserbacteria bacterium RIFCSPHIGHO2_02_FULL_50_9]|uniref:Diadenosine tetraphosphate hydrolase n=1 Tax=Candidatus Kaiserbacteria bacterium RIFCSPLOWO2_01_FULL_51_21 TaxID=1798508 RepID=A0A1F6EDT2_9BACT|nr:MAG: diadenosine tetraphosphate hydrolase [Candidatus Kaiserbacteria bacterium RIFCSPHIGHO2_01_FULL_51_33]OGG63515.1 MAG: diadenosine tetraphosphate hydrolase [Candidatus Kaiserbacteria bacterium RIFCSPHIGHO2_02_FULL_50_9]OGG71791.1 MAG: diadenosine tetraphosphate hydrolase [Candidatus Kaiserbacteria bacterium RIFCSPLOWO2_01_FULL_51_21]